MEREEGRGSHLQKVLHRNTKEKGPKDGTIMSLSPEWPPANIEPRSRTGPCFNIGIVMDCNVLVMSNGGNDQANILPPPNNNKINVSPRTEDGRQFDSRD